MRIPGIGQDFNASYSNYNSDLVEVLIKDMHMQKAANLEQAVIMAGNIIGNQQSKITVIPDGVAVIVR
ncbi:hypothetical protein GM661_01420 [Iocasia frigidifontis]|uniref:Lactate racemase C-terminal domain-containing protein n=1 Tax=Iocasia fonsfrigidae TaxID=2682810 RepID=A0A8A7K4W8_9FIRM|nr:hypothetical protein GM661_01420 [Iocasia fonsfrigidae]